MDDVKNNNGNTLRNGRVNSMASDKSVQVALRKKLRNKTNNPQTDVVVAYKEIKTQNAKK